MRLLIAVVLLLLCSCSSSSVIVRASAGYDAHPDNHNAVGVVEIEKPINDHFYWRWQHRSDLTRGEPFNDWGENYSHEMLLFGGEYEFDIKDIFLRRSN